MSVVAASVVVVAVGIVDAVDDAVNEAIVVNVDAVVGAAEVLDRRAVVVCLGSLASGGVVRRTPPRANVLLNFIALTGRSLTGCCQ